MNESILYKYLGDSSSFDKANTRVQQGLGSLQSLAIQASGALGAMFGGVSIMGALQAAGKFEETTINFETMLGSVEEAQKTLADLTKFAEQTPFEMPGIENAARGLIQFGERGDDLMDTLKFLGNAASGTSTDFGMISLIFNQVRGVGKLLTQDFRQLSTRGVLSLQDVADHFGVTTGEAQKMMSAGKISFEAFRDILKGLSAEGGRFENLMEKQSKSFLGLWSTISDAVGIEIRKIGMSLLPVGKMFQSFMLTLIESFAALPQPIKTAIGLFAALGSIIGGAILIIAPMSGVIAGLFSSVVGTVMAIVPTMIGLITGFVPALIGMVGGFISLLPVILPVVLVLGTLAAVIGAVVYGLETVFGLGNIFRAAKEAFMDFSAPVRGFFHNFRENIGILTKYFMDNWKEILQQLPGALIHAFGSIVTTTIHNFKVGFGVILEIGRVVGLKMFELFSKAMELTWTVDLIMWARKGFGNLIMESITTGAAVKNALTGNVLDSFLIATNMVSGVGTEPGKPFAEAIKDILAGAMDEIQMPDLFGGFDLPELGLNLTTPELATENMKNNTKEANDELDKFLNKLKQPLEFDPTLEGVFGNPAANKNRFGRGRRGGEDPQAGNDGGLLGNFNRQANQALEFEADRQRKAEAERVRKKFEFLEGFGEGGFLKTQIGGGGLMGDLSKQITQSLQAMEESAILQRAIDEERKKMTPAGQGTDIGQIEMRQREAERERLKNRLDFLTGFGEKKETDPEIKNLLSRIADAITEEGNNSLKVQVAGETGI